MALRAMCKYSKLLTDSHWSRGGSAVRHLKRVLWWREGRVSGEGSGRVVERPLEVSASGGMVGVWWPAPLLWQDLCSRWKGPPLTDCVSTPWHPSSRTCWQVEDTGVCSLELLVATDVPLHWSVCEDMQPLPPHQCTVASTYPRIISAHYSGIPLGHHQHQLHSQTPRVSWLQWNHECCRLTRQGVSLHSNTHDNHHPWCSPLVPHTHLEVAQTSETGHFQPRSAVHSRADTRALLPVGDPSKIRPYSSFTGLLLSLTAFSFRKPKNKRKAE